MIGRPATGSVFAEEPHFVNQRTELTRHLSRQHKRPCLVVDLDQPPQLTVIRRWLAEHHVQTLNVAGPRESQNPGIGILANRFLCRLFQQRRRPRQNS